MSEREKPEQAAYDLGFEEGHRLGVEEGARQERERAIKAQDRCDALELELVDLRLDRQRLDWLDTISYATELAGGKDLWKVNLVVPRSDETDFRKLVDAARRNPGEDEPPIRSTVTVPEGRRRLRSGLPHDSEKK